LVKAGDKFTCGSASESLDFNIFLLDCKWSVYETNPKQSAESKEGGGFTEIVFSMMTAEEEATQDQDYM
jgi:hypothetical protein